MEDSERFADTFQQWDILQSYTVGKSVCEIGVCLGGSSRTFMRAPCKSLVSIELKPVPGVEEELRKVADVTGCDWTFVVGDSLAVDPPECDVLFIDSYHTARQLLAELHRYAPFVRETILLHDTGYWGQVGEDGDVGLCSAVDLFCSEGNGWKVSKIFDVYPGLTVLEKADAP